MVQLLNEMLAAFLIILVALDARLDMACVGLARIRVRLIGHVQPVGATSSTLGKFAADHVASHAEFGQTRPSHLDVEVTNAGPRGNRLDPRGTRIEPRRWCVLYYHVPTRCQVPWDGEAAAAADPAV